MEEMGVKAEVKSMPKTEKSEKVEPEKGKDDGLSQLRDEEEALLGTIGSDMDGLHDEALREILAKDQLQGVGEILGVESNGGDVGEVKETDSCKENVASAVVPVSEVAVETHEVETTHCVTVSSEPSTVDESLSSNPVAPQDVAQVSVPTKPEQRSDYRMAKNLSVSPVLRTPSRDGYNWRKYGQKQVKSPKGSRSYYRCTYSDCCAKKIECSNDSGNLIEIVNKGSHSHKPLQKNSFSPREIRPASAIQPVSEDNTVVRELAIVSSGPAPSISTKENICESQTVVKRKRHCENESLKEPEPKRRLKKDNSQTSDSISEPEEKHKFVVHSAADVGISSDGYRWRKYGQKMVKGNPNPRNYYRCSFVGCPVRKHIESAVEITTGVTISYKGVHNHDTPVPKECHGPPSSMLVVAVAPTSMRTKSDDQLELC